MTALLERTTTPTESDRRLASESSQFLEPLISLPHEVRVQLLDENTPPNSFLLPASALRLLHEILKEMAQGNTVTLMPVHAMLTTQEAADILDVSRPFLVGLLQAGKIPYQRIGSHRRILFRDLMAFKEEADRQRDAPNRGGDDVTVTFNLKDFPGSILAQYSLEAQHPDTFVQHLLDLDEAKVCDHSRAATGFEKTAQVPAGLAGHL